MAQVLPSLARRVNGSRQRGESLGMQESYIDGTGVPLAGALG